MIEKKGFGPMAWYSDLSRMADTERLSDELSALRREMALIQRKLRRGGGNRFAAAEDQGAQIYDELSQRVSDAWPLVQHQAQAVGRYARDHRTSLIVGAAAIVGLLALVAVRKR